MTRKLAPVPDMADLTPEELAFIHVLRLWAQLRIEHGELNLRHRILLDLIAKWLGRVADTNYHHVYENAKGDPQL